MKTIVYVDGYNFYYGRLKNTPYKWLDFYHLFDRHIIKPIEPRATLLQVKFFTSDIQARFSSSGQQAVMNQSHYLGAIKAYSSDKIEIIKGKYSAAPVEAPKHKIPPNRKDTVKVWKIEEKQTDVSLALNIYRDVARELCEQIVIASNDTDLEPALNFVRKDYPHIKIGVVIPRSEESKRPPSNALTIKSDWYRSYIKNHELEASQLPVTINKPNGRGVFTKPEMW